MRDWIDQVGLERREEMSVGSLGGELVGWDES
jgi:hypothetical protein